MSKTLYLECYSGISGDMTVAALLDLGADEDVLRHALQSLPLDEFDIKITRVKKSGLDACDFRVLLDERHDPHDHDMDYLHGHEHERLQAHGHSQAHEHEHGHSQAHEHDCGHAHFHGHHSHAHNHAHPHVHRGLSEIREIIENSKLSSRAKDTALRIFQVLAEAEAKAHGIPVGQVHFHEVGAADSIADIAAAAVCLDNLDIGEVIVSELYEGRGTIRCQHGIIPIPAPAVANIASAHRLTLRLTKTESELVTPTGAAIAAAIKTADALPDAYRILKTGMGAGKRDYGRAGILRAMLIEPTGKTDDANNINDTSNTNDTANRNAVANANDKNNTNAIQDTIWHLESNIDDCAGERLGYVMERLMEAGARDVYYSPIYMKKNRPAYELHVLCKETERKRLEEIIFQDTSTIGIRRVEMERTALKRRIQQIDTPMGKAQVKLCEIGAETRIYPEYDSVIRLCKEQGVSWPQAWDAISQAARELTL